VLEFYSGSLTASTDINSQCSTSLAVTAWATPLNVFLLSPHRKSCGFTRWQCPSACLSVHVCSFVRLGRRHRCPIFHPLEKLPFREIYACGGGLLITSINAPHLIVSICILYVAAALQIQISLHIKCISNTNRPTENILTNYISNTKYISVLKLRICNTERLCDCLDKWNCCVSSFPIDPQNFPRMTTFYQKLPLFCNFFKSYNVEIWREGVNPGVGFPSPCQML